MNSTETGKFQQAFNRFERLLELQGYTTATQGSYCRGIRQFALWYGSAQPTLTREIGVDFLIGRTGQGVPAATHWKIGQKHAIFDGPTNFQPPKLCLAACGTRI